MLILPISVILAINTANALEQFGAPPAKIQYGFAAEIKDDTPAAKSTTIKSSAIKTTTESPGAWLLKYLYDFDNGSSSDLSAGANSMDSLDDDDRFRGMIIDSSDNTKTTTKKSTTVIPSTVPPSTTTEPEPSDNDDTQTKYDLLDTLFLLISFALVLIFVILNSSCSPKFSC